MKYLVEMKKFKFYLISIKNNGRSFQHAGMHDAFIIWQHSESWNPKNANIAGRFHYDENEQNPVQCYRECQK